MEGNKVRAESTRRRQTQFRVRSRKPKRTFNSNEEGFTLECKKRKVGEKTSTKYYVDKSRCYLEDGNNLIKCCYVVLERQKDIHNLRQQVRLDTGVIVEEQCSVQDHDDVNLESSQTKDTENNGDQSQTDGEENCRTQPREISVNELTKSNTTQVEEIGLPGEKQLTRQCELAVTKMRHMLTKHGPKIQGDVYATDQESEDSWGLFQACTDPFEAGQLVDVHFIVDEGGQSDLIPNPNDQVDEMQNEHTMPSVAAGSELTTSKIRQYGVGSKRKRPCQSESAVSVGSKGLQNMSDRAIHGAKQTSNRQSLSNVRTDKWTFSQRQIEEQQERRRCNIDPKQIDQGSYDILVADEPDDEGVGFSMELGKKYERHMQWRGRLNALAAWRGRGGYKVSSQRSERLAQAANEAELVFRFWAEEAQIEYRKEKAMLYLRDVRTAYKQSPQVYNKFVDLVRSLKETTIPAKDIRQEVRDLFADKPHLIKGFSMFLTSDTTEGTLDDQDNEVIGNDNPPSLSDILESGTDSANPSTGGALADLEKDTLAHSEIDTTTESTSSTANSLRENHKGSPAGEIRNVSSRTKESQLRGILNTPKVYLSKAKINKAEITIGSIYPPKRSLKRAPRSLSQSKANQSAGSDGVDVLVDAVSQVPVHLTEQPSELPISESTSEISDDNTQQLDAAASTQQSSHGNIIKEGSSASSRTEALGGGRVESGTEKGLEVEGESQNRNLLRPITEKELRIELQSQDRTQQVSPQTENLTRTENVPQTENQSRMFKETAMSYLKDVKTAYRQSPQIYNRFVTLVRSLQETTKPAKEIRQEIAELFEGNPHLITGFNVFLPNDTTQETLNESADEDTLGPGSQSPTDRLRGTPVHQVEDTLASPERGAVRDAGEISSSPIKNIPRRTLDLDIRSLLNVPIIYPGIKSLMDSDTLSVTQTSNLTIDTTSADLSSSGIDVTKPFILKFNQAADAQETQLLRDAYTSSFPQFPQGMGKRIIQPTTVEDDSNPTPSEELSDSEPTTQVLAETEDETTIQANTEIVTEQPSHDDIDHSAESQSQTEIPIASEAESGHELSFEAENEEETKKMEAVASLFILSQTPNLPGLVEAPHTENHIGTEPESSQTECYPVVESEAQNCLEMGEAVHQKNMMASEGTSQTENQMEAEVESQTESQPETEGKLRTENQQGPETELQAENQQGPEVELQAESQQGPKVELQAESHKGPEVQLQGESQDPEVELQAESHQDPMVEIQAESHKGPEVELEGESHQGPEVELKAESHEGPMVELKAKSHKGPEVELQGESHQGPEVELHSESHQGPEVELHAESHQGPETELQIVSNQGSEVELKAESHQGPMVELQAESHKGPEVELQAESHQGPEVELHAESHQGPETEIQIVSNQGSEVELKAESHQGPMVELQAESHKGPEVELQAESHQGPEVELQGESHQDPEVELHTESHQGPEVEVQGQSLQGAQVELHGEGHLSPETEFRAYQSPGPYLQAETHQRAEVISQIENDLGITTDHPKKNVVRTEVESETESHHGAEEENENQLQGESEPHTEIQSGAEAESQTEIHISIQTDSQTDKLLGTEVESQTENHQKVEVESQTTSHQEAEAESQTENTPKIEADSQTEKLLCEEVESQTESPEQTEADSQTENHLTMETESQTEKVLRIEGESQTHSHQEAEAESQTEHPLGVETEAQTEKCLRSEATSQTENQLVVEVESQTESGEGRDAASNSKTNAGSETKRQTEGDQQTVVLSAEPSVSNSELQNNDPVYVDEGKALSHILETSDSVTRQMVRQMETEAKATQVLTGERSVNKVTLLGRVGRPAEMRGTADYPVTIFPLATSISIKREDGTYEQQTEWHRISIFRKGLRDIAAASITTGDRVYVSGSIKYGSFEQDGRTVYSTSIVADDVIRLTAKAAAQSSETPGMD